MMNHQAIQDNWDQIKKELPLIWEDLTVSDLENLQGSLQETVSFLQDKYGMTESDVLRELDYLLQAIHDSES